MKRFLANVNQRLPTILLVLGACGVSGGVAMMCAAAGVIVAGAFCLTAGVLMTRGGGGDEPT